MGKSSNKRKKSANDKDTSNNDDSFVEIKLQMEHLEGDLFEIKQALENTVEELKQLKSENIRLKEENICNNQKLVTTSQKLNDLEQYSRRSNIRIRGIPDSGPNESQHETEVLVINFLKRKFKGTIMCHFGTFEKRPRTFPKTPIPACKIILLPHKIIFTPLAFFFFSFSSN